MGGTLSIGENGYRRGPRLHRLRLATILVCQCSEALHARSEGFNRGSVEDG